MRIVSDVCIVTDLCLHRYSLVYPYSLVSCTQIGELVGEVLRVAWVETQSSRDASNTRPLMEQETAAHSLRETTEQVVECCMRRLEASNTPFAAEEQQSSATSRPEEAAERLMSAAASVGYDVLMLVADKVCRELEGACALQDAGRTTDLSQVAAALALCQAMAARPRALAHHCGTAGDVDSHGLSGVTRAVARVLGALDHSGAKLAGGKRGLAPHSVATHAQHCLSLLSNIKTQRAAVAAG